jgi:hypothetical protein
MDEDLHLSWLRGSVTRERWHARSDPWNVRHQRSGEESTDAFHERPLLVVGCID